jgi:hypothetical protein
MKLGEVLQHRWIVANTEAQPQAAPPPAAPAAKH